jgi:hypothetical protein
MSLLSNILFLGVAWAGWQICGLIEKWDETTAVAAIAFFALTLSGLGRYSRDK